MSFRLETMGFNASFTGKIAPHRQQLRIAKSLVTRGTYEFCAAFLLRTR